jgi:carboxyl-terminal processing protease
MVGSMTVNRTVSACLFALALLGMADAARADPACADKPFEAATAWAEVRKELADNYAYWDRIDAKAVFDAASPAMLAAPDRLAFADRLETLLLLFRDSHVHVSPTSKPSMAWVPSAADLWFEETGGKLLVSDVKWGSVAAERGVRPGWVLATLDGTDPRETARKRFAELGLSPDPAQLTYAVNALAAGRLDQPRRFVFRAGRKTVRLDLPPGYGSVRRPADPLTVSHRRDPAGHDVAVLRINNSLGDSALIAAFDAAIAAVPATSHTIVDMRDTPSGGTSTVARAIIGHYAAQAAPYQRHELTAERVQGGVPRIWLEYVQPRAPVRAAPLVLAGRWTGSMGEGIVIGLNAAGKARIVGSPMGQLLGAIIQDEMPAACITVSFANEKLWHVDGRPRETVLPDLPLPTADVAADGSDAALTLALAALSADERPAP